MHPPLFDFVSALSAEESCPVCDELHAAVDQRECADCKRAVCPDCASLRPDTAWVCAACVKRRPARIFAIREQASVGAAQAAYGSLAAQARGLVQRSATPQAYLRDRARPFFAALWLAFVATLPVLRAVALASLVALRRGSAQLGDAVAHRAEPLLDALREHQRRVTTSFLRDWDAVRDAASELLAPHLPRVRLRLSHAVLSIRNVSLREQLTGMLLGTAILIAVARGDRRDPR